jgi:hypothetical protein
MAVSNEKIFDKLIEVSEVVAGIAPIVADLKKAVITGNGHPGLLRRVEIIEDCHATESENKKEKKATKEKWGTRGWALFSGILLYVITNIIVVVGIFEKLQTLK